MLGWWLKRMYKVLWYSWAFPIITWRKNNSFAHPCLFLKQHRLSLSLNSTRSLMQLTIALQMTLLGILNIEMHWWLSQTFLVPLLCNRTTSDFFQSLGMTSSLQTWSARCCKRCTTVTTKPKDASAVNWETATLISSSVSGGVLSSSPASICKHTTLLKQVLSVLVHLSAPYTSVF